MIQATDSLANSGQRPMTVIRKPQENSMRIVSPADGDVSVYPDITIEGVYEDEFIDRIEIFNAGTLIGTNMSAGKR